MERTVNGIPVHYVERGEGMPVLVLHGSGVDHRELLGALDAHLAAPGGLRRIYPDLPGMGRTPAPDTILSLDDVVDVLLGLVDRLTGGSEFLVVGHSAGGYLGGAIADRRRDRVVGLAAICPLVEAVRALPEHEAVHVADGAGASASSGSDAFEDYFVVRTPESRRRFEERVAPGAALADPEAMARIGQRWRLSPAPEDGPPFERPTLIVTGRQDAAVGYAGPWELLPHYPRATFAVLDRAGHALPHEQPELLGALIGEWLHRARESRTR